MLHCGRRLSSPPEKNRTIAPAGLVHTLLPLSALSAEAVAKVRGPLLTIAAVCKASLSTGRSQAAQALPVRLTKRDPSRIMALHAEFPTIT